MTTNFRGCSETLIEEVLNSTSTTEWRSQRDIREIAFGDYSTSMVWAALKILKDRGQIESMSVFGQGGKMLYRKKPVVCPIKWPDPGVKLFFDITRADLDRINKRLPLSVARV